MYLTAMSETVYLSTRGVAGNNAAVRPRAFKLCTRPLHQEQRHRIAFVAT